ASVKGFSSFFRLVKCGWISDHNVSCVLVKSIVMCSMSHLSTTSCASCISASLFFNGKMIPSDSSGQACLIRLATTAESSPPLTPTKSPFTFASSTCCCNHSIICSTSVSIIGAPFLYAILFILALTTLYEKKHIFQYNSENLWNQL